MYVEKHTLLQEGSLKLFNFFFMTTFTILSLAAQLKFSELKVFFVEYPMWVIFLFEVFQPLQIRLAEVIFQPLSTGCFSAVSVILI